MAHNSKLRRIRLVFGLSNVNADFFQLILCMLVSHYLIANPLYGGALFLFANIWTLWFQGSLRNIKFQYGRAMSAVMWILLTLSVFIGLALVFIFPTIKNEAYINYVSFFVLLLTARSVISYWINKTYTIPRRSTRILKFLFQVLFIVPCAAFVLWLMNGAAVWITIGGFALTGFFVAYQTSTMAGFAKHITRQQKDKTTGIYSYRIFSNMTLYSQIAFSLGILMFVCYMSFSGTAYSEGTYLGMGLWLFAIFAAFELFTWLANRRGIALNLNFFIVGVALWVLGSIEIYHTSDFLMIMLWTSCWGFGLSAISAVTNRFSADIRMVARFSDRRISDRDLYYRNLLTQVIAVIISNVIVLCVMAVWVFFVPMFTDIKLPGLVRQIMIQLPVLFMIVALIFALRQPLDERASQKLSNYMKGVNHNRQTRKSLRKSLVDRNRVRFGVKIIAFFVRPFLRLKVSGDGNMDFKDFPSIFICNHGIIYGPVAAVIYLPTYFRPWIDKKMCDREMCEREMYHRFIRRIPVLPARMKKWIAHVLAGPVTWAMNSFNPIPVEKNNLRNVMSTFEATVKVLTEGDNVLIFPEKPRQVKKRGQDAVLHETDTVGRLSTGFAGIGSLYYEKTGKSLKFYPIYANNKRLTFRIGEPVTFYPSGDPHEEKQRISGELRARMLELVDENPVK